MRVLPRVVEQNIASQRFHDRATLAEPRRSVIDGSMHNSGARDKAAPGAEIFADAGEDVTEAESLSIASKNSFPERRGARNSVRFVEAFRALKRRAIHLSEDQSTVHVGHAVVVTPEDTVRVRNPKPRLPANVALRAHDVVDRSLLAGSR